MTRLNLGAGMYRLVGFDNLDKTTGWLAENGLDYPDDSVEGITWAHFGMYVAEADWPALLAECLRVLEPGGVIRITEDATDVPASDRFGGYHDAVTLTSATKTCDALEAAGFRAYVVGSDETMFSDKSLIQVWHGREPRVFFVEGVKPV